MSADRTGLAPGPPSQALGALEVHVWITAPALLCGLRRPSAPLWACLLSVHHPSNHSAQ